MTADCSPLQLSRVFGNKCLRGSGARWSPPGLPPPAALAQQASFRAARAQTDLTVISKQPQHINGNDKRVGRAEPEPKGGAARGAAAWLWCTGYAGCPYSGTSYHALQAQQVVAKLLATLPTACAKVHPIVILGNSAGESAVSICHAAGPPPHPPHPPHPTPASPPLPPLS